MDKLKKRREISGQPGEWEPGDATGYYTKKCFVVATSLLIKALEKSTVESVGFARISIGEWDSILGKMKREADQFCHEF